MTPHNPNDPLLLSQVFSWNPSKPGESGSLLSTASPFSRDSFTGSPGRAAVATVERALHRAAQLVEALGLVAGAWAGRRLSRRAATV